MNAIREIIDVESDEVIIKLPQHFQKVKVEVIILPVENEQVHVDLS